MRKRSLGSKKATAYHESGHPIMCWKLGVALKKVTIVPNADTSGACHHDKLVRGIFQEVVETAKPTTPLRMRRGWMQSPHPHLPEGRGEVFSLDILFHSAA